MHTVSFPQAQMNDQHVFDFSTIGKFFQEISCDVLPMHVTFYTVNYAKFQNAFVQQ